jgi:hypothetical protein
MQREIIKISRLQYLRLLGAGAVGYFVYRAGFINSLFDILQKPVTRVSDRDYSTGNWNVHL